MNKYEALEQKWTLRFFLFCGYDYLKICLKIDTLGLPVLRKEVMCGVQCAVYEKERC